MNSRIKVVDSPCGWGKSSYAIQYINSLNDDVKVIYITPFLSETERVKVECPSKNFCLPSVQKGKGSKLVNFIDLINKGKNISSTHALFSNISNELVELLKSKNYILILDEVMNVVEKYDLYRDDYKKDEDEKEKLTNEDINTLISQNIVNISNNGLVKWNNNVDILNKYIQLKELADRDMLYYLNNDLLIWTFPIEVFSEGIFKEIFILTYQFDYQIQAYYYKYFNLEYEKYIVHDIGNRVYKLFPLEEKDSKNYDSEWRKNISNLINIYSGEKLNEIGDYYYDGRGREHKASLSKNWYEKTNEDSLKLLQKNISNYFSNITRAKSNEKLWTTFKSYKSKLKNSYISSKSWLECTCRASNEYSNRNVLVYAVNRYLNPFYEQFFATKNIYLNQDKYALSEMIQWIFRSAIRNNNPINIYIPSQRMRELLIEWLSGGEF